MVETKVGDFIRGAVDTYNYVTGKSGKKTHSLSNLKTATSSEIALVPELQKLVKEFGSSKGKLDVKIDRKSKGFLVTFSAGKVPKTLVKSMTEKDEKFNGVCYYDYVTKYDPSSKEVEMVFMIDNNKNLPSNEKGEVVDSEEESVMQPTPTPYKLELKTEDIDEEDTEYTLVDRKYVNDSDGFRTEYSWYMDFDGNSVFILGDSDFYTPEDGSFDHEEEDPEVAQEWFDSYNGFGDDEDDIFESLLETDGLDTSVLVRKIDDQGRDSIEMDINGRVYSFTMKEDSPYTIDQMMHKVTKMRHYSEGRALQFMKKNMIGKRVESLVESKYAVQYYNNRLRKWITAQTYKDEETANKDLPFHKKMCGAPGQGPLKDHEIKVVKLKESKAEVDSSEKVVTLVINDAEDQIIDLIKCIQSIANAGHSFNVVVDPDNEDYKNEFYIDGDGSDKINEIKTSDSVTESKNPFKDKHICDGCGKPLSRCTCEVQEEEEVEEALTESVTTETYKTIKIELNDPDSQLENLIKCIKAVSDPGHSFAVVVDGDPEKSFTMDGDGSFRITGIEVKDEVEDVEVKESLSEAYEYYPETSTQIARTAIGRAVTDVGGKLVRKKDGRVSYQAKDQDIFEKGKSVILKFIADSHNESLDGSGATQPSNIGQYKRSKLDMFPDHKDKEGSQE